MSAAAPFSYDHDEALRYAPPWARSRSTREADKPTAERIDHPSPSLVTPSLARQAEGPTQGPGPVDLDVNSVEDEEVLRNIMRRRSLDPQPMPPPPIDLREERRIYLFRLFGLPVAFSALTAYLFVTLLGGIEQKAGASLWSRAFGVAVQNQPVSATPRLRLPAQNRSSFANRQIPLGIGVTASMPGASVVIAGLANGTKLTVGMPISNNGWRIAVGDIEHAFVVPPIDFVGSMDLSVDLRLADDAIADRNVVRLNWMQLATNVEAKADRQKIRSAVSAEPAKAATKSDPVSSSIGRDLDHEEISALLKRGTDLIGRSDISAARLVLRRAAEGGSARAAFALAASYDPAFLEKIGVVGAKPNVEKAWAWYAKAAALGSDRAPQHLERLAHQGP